MPRTSCTTCQSDPPSTSDVTLASIVQLTKLPAEILSHVLPREHWDQSGNGTLTPQSFLPTAASSSTLATSTACTVIQYASCLYSSINHNAGCLCSSINHDAACIYSSSNHDTSCLYSSINHNAACLYSSIRNYTTTMPAASPCIHASYMSYHDPKSGTAQTIEHYYNLLVKG